MRTFEEIQKIVPAELQAINSWCLWKLEQKNGRQTKVPYQVNGRWASTADSSTWNSLQTCWNTFRSGSYNGVGLILSPAVDVTFIDLDHCLTEGQPNQLAQSVLNQFPDTYTEVSQSGTGLHLFVHGAIPHAVKRSEIELYHTGRYCACTFNSFNSSSAIRSGGQELQDLFQKYDRGKKKKRRAPAPVIFQDDETVLRRACRADSKFADLYAGNWTPYYSSHSEADCALCCKLAFWTDRNEGQINRLFCTSGLYRSKWDREDYKRRTLEFAVNAVEESFTEWRDAKRLEYSNNVLKNF